MAVYLLSAPAGASWRILILKKNTKKPSIRQKPSLKLSTQFPMNTPSHQPPYPQTPRRTPRRMPRQIAPILTVAQLLACASAAQITRAQATPQQQQTPQHVSARFAHGVIDIFTDSPSPVDCVTLWNRVQRLLDDFNAQRTAAVKCAGCPVFFDLADGKTEVQIGLAGKRNNARKRFFSVLIQRKGTQEDPAGIFNGEMNKVCIE